MGRFIWLGAKSLGGEVGHGDGEVGKNQISQITTHVLSSSDYPVGDGEGLIRFYTEKNYDQMYVLKRQLW